MKTTITKLTVNYCVFSDETKTEIISEGAHIFSHAKPETAQNKCTAFVKKFRRSLTTPGRVQITSA